MIDKGLIESHLSSILRDTEVFLVDVKVDRQNRITVHLDTREGISIDDCVRISRELESMLDRDVEDFSLEVSSPGLDAPFRVLAQYEKNLGKMLEVTDLQGVKTTGRLKELKKEGFVLEIPPAKKAGEHVVREFSFGGIKSARIHIRF